MGGFKSCHISHFFSYKNTCVSCLLLCVCVCVCVVCLWNRVSCVVCSVFVGVLVWAPSKFSIFPRARNDGLTVLRNLTLTVSHNLLKSRITLSRCARPQPEVSTKFFQQDMGRTVRKTPSRLPPTLSAQIERNCCF